MASLTTISVAARKTIRYTIFFIIFLTIGRFALIYTLRVYRSVFPTPPPPPTTRFGLMPKLPFPDVKNLPQFEFKVETSKGNSLPTLLTQAKVYVMPKITKNLFSLESTKKKADAMGYTNDPESVTETIYKFKHPQAPSTLQMDIVYNNFSVSYNLANDPQPLDQQPPAPEVAVQQAKNFLTNPGLLPADLTGPDKHDFLKIAGQSLVPTISLSESNLIRVSLFRKDLDKIPSVTPNPDISNVWFIISGDSSRARQVIAAELHYFPLDVNQVSTYPTKTSQQAFSNLQNGKGYIAKLGDNKDGKVTIRNAYFAYYDAGAEVQFYQPVIVFEGDRNFIAYVPAITDAYYGK